MTDFTLGQKHPNKAEILTVGTVTGKINRDSKSFKTLISNSNDSIIYKDEEGTGADLIMSSKTAEDLNSLASLVQNEWSNIKLRVTDAWDEDNEHSNNPLSTHYEGRGVDLTLYPNTPDNRRKFGRLSALCVEAGFDWVFYENELHVHVSNARDCRGGWESEIQRGGKSRWEFRIAGDNCIWKERNSSGGVYTRRCNIVDKSTGTYLVKRENDIDMLKYLGATDQTASQIISMNPPASTMEIYRTQGNHDNLIVRWTGLAWTLNPNGSVRDIKMLSSNQNFYLV